MRRLLPVQQHCPLSHGRVAAPAIILVPTDACDADPRDENRINVINAYNITMRNIKRRPQKKKLKYCVHALRSVATTQLLKTQSPCEARAMPSSQCVVSRREGFALWPTCQLGLTHCSTHTRHHACIYYGHIIHILQNKTYKILSDSNSDIRTDANGMRKDPLTVEIVDAGRIMCRP